MGERPLTLPTETDPVTVLHGDSLAVLRELPDAAFDCVITDPPYSSGGFTRGDRQADVATKYQQSGTVKEYPPFCGDTRDQRSYGYWSALWMCECLRLTTPGAIMGVFTDWRQLPTTTDALQAGGWVFRGIVAWHKPGARPTQGRFTNECEYLVWGTNGPRPLEGSPLPGWYSVGVNHNDKHHLTGKPVPLMRKLVQCCPPGGVILDPFAGSGTTGVAAAMEGRRAVLVEKEPAYVEITRRRVAECLRPGLFAAV